MRTGHAMCGVLLISSMAFAQARPGWLATKVAKTPVVDGSLSEWQPGLFSIAPPIELGGFVEEGAITDAKDHAVEAWAVVTGATLYIAAQVTDDQVVAKHRAQDIWQDDGVEVLLGGGLHLGVSPLGEVWAFKGPARLEGVRAAARVTAPGYVVELAVPLKLFANGRNEGPWAVNLASRDVDRDSVAHRTWAGYRHHQLGTFGTMHLVAASAQTPAVKACPLVGAPVTLSAPLTVKDRSLMAGSTPVRLRLVNYQSAAKSWVQFWTQFDLPQIERDLEAAAKFGANGVRIFVFWEEFGGAAPTEDMAKRLEAVVGAAAARGLVSVVSFFPFKKEFARSRWAEMEPHLRALVRRFRGKPSIAMWDLMNEPDHVWAAPGATVKATDVAAWAKHMYAAVKDEDPTHLVTVGLAGHFAARGDAGIDDAEALPFVDVVSVHGYFERPWGEFFERASSLGKPVVLQEYGQTRRFFSAEQARDADATMCRAAKLAELAGVGAWELFDHPVGSIAWYSEPWREGDENYFGLLDANGRSLPRAAAFCTCLDATRFVIRR